MSVTKGRKTVRKNLSTLRAVEKPAAKGKPRLEVKDGLDELRHWFEQKGVTKAKVGGFDIDGVLRGKYVSLEKFFSAAKGGLGFCDVIFGWDIGDVLYDNAKVTGWHTGYPDAHAMIDLSTVRIIPWEPDTAAFLLDFVNKDGSPYAASPRPLLKKRRRPRAPMGFRAEVRERVRVLPLPRDARSRSARRASTGCSRSRRGCSATRGCATSSNAALVHAIVDGCNAFDIEIEGLHTETGPGVYESAIRYDDLEQAADKSVLFKTAMKQICARHGVTACFMAKWNAKLPGCSGHLHQSLWSLDGERNAFHDPKARGGMSKILRHYLAGQLALMPELTALYSPTINSYKRSVENTWAPLTATWGIENRTCAIRVIGDSPKSTRLEYRQLGADINPYLAMAASLAAGLYGIERELEPPEACAGNGYQAEARPLPRNLREATAAARAAEVARELLGEGFVDHYVRTREWEVRQYERAVTDWELERYLELI